ncbi:VirD4-like conjugal transfer protein, CD1115 family [Streptococcus sanguinis]|uniref:VirD4-like conjugal transfer protein, CD1115 family n=1 Tax=Streptococcus sanguinis TaxID=1305 RepID=UPI003561A6C2
MTERKPLPYIITAGILFYCLHWLAKLFEMSPDTAINDDFGLARLEWMGEHWNEKFPIDVQFTSFSLMAGLVGVMAVLFFFARRQDRGIYRTGEEHGTARFATVEELASFQDQDPEKNMIFTQRAQMGLFNQRLPYNKHINKNVLVIGGTGDWKTRSFVKPNIMQLNSSYVITDTKGLIIHEVGTILKKAGYKIKILDLIQLINSDGFNVFHYMQKETDIDKVSEAIITATKRSDNKGEDFWAQAEAFLTRALIGYLYFDGKVLGKYEPNLPQVADLLRFLKRTDPEIESPVEEMFKQLEEELPGNYANKQFQLFMKNFGGQTLMSVLAIISSRFSVFDHDDVRKMVQRDTMEIEKWQLEKTAVFIHMPETDKSYQFLSALFFHTIFEVSNKTADSITQGTHPTATIEALLHLQIYADETGQIGQIPYLPEEIAVVRSREISIKLMIQSMSQLQQLYGDKNTTTILNNCGAVLYLGSNDPDTLKSMADRTGPQTIQQTKTSKSYGQHGSSSESTDSLKRELLNYHEVATVAIDEALLYLNRQNVFKDKKYRLETHPQYENHADGPFSPNWFTYRRYMSDIDEWLENVELSNQVEISMEELEEIALPWDLSA